MDFHILNHSCIPGMKPILSIGIQLFMGARGTENLKGNGRDKERGLELPPIHLLSTPPPPIASKMKEQACKCSLSKVTQIAHTYIY